MPPSTQTRRIIITADTKGNEDIKRLSEALGGINKNTKDMAKSMNLLTSGTAAFLGGLSIRQLTSFSDEIQNLNNRLLTMGGGTGEAAKTMQSLVSISRETNQTLQGTAETYFRMSLALKDAGVSQASLLDMTKTIANTFRLSGASTQEAANATIQLGQAFSLGVLRGQDLRSVMSQNVVLTRLLRKEFGSDLLKQAEKGLITVPKLMKVLFDNMKSVDEQAKLMSATFEQGFTKALDAFKIKIFEVNQALGASDSFNSLVTLTINNMGSLITVATILAVSTLPLLVKGIYSVATALGILNPAVIAGAAGLAVVVGLFGNSWDIGDLALQLRVGFLEIQALLKEAVAALYEFRSNLAFTSYEVEDKYKKMAAAARQSAKDLRTHGQALYVLAEVEDELNRRRTETANAEARRAKDIQNASGYFKQDLTAKQQLAALNKEFLDGSISAAEYNEKILDTQASMAKWKFKEGEKTLDQYNEALRKLDIARLNREFQDGSVTLDEFTSKSRIIGLQKLNEEFRAGKIDVEKYNEQISSLQNSLDLNSAARTGLQDYVKSIGTTTQQVAGLIKNTFSQLEDAIVEFTKSGEFNFNKMAQAILDDLTRIIIRASIIQPLAQGLLSYATTPSSSPTLPASNADYSNVAAKGAYFDGSISRFASGGVVNRPTMFRHSGNKTGLMGEAGPEAILPLKRGSGGSLGVQATVTPVTVNVINQSGNEVQQKETMGPNGERTVEILITGKVKELIGSGKLDKVMKQSYGVTRKGS